MRPVTSEGAATHASRKAGYETERPDLQRHIPLTSRRILDLGCCTGALGAALKRRQQTTVLGVELDGAYATDARTRLDRVVTSDVERFLAGPVPPEAPFDCLIAADVLEHLVDPWLALSRAADLLQPEATAVISLPNVADYRVFWRVLRTGRWPREDVGVFDRTHLRWFTLADGLDLVQQAGLRPIAIDPRYWTAGWHLRWRLVAAKTPLHRYLPPQYVFCAVKDGLASAVPAQGGVGTDKADHGDAEIR